jgi:hypothetical protein
MRRRQLRLHRRRRRKGRGGYFSVRAPQARSPPRRRSLTSRRRSPWHGAQAAARNQGRPFRRRLRSAAARRLGRQRGRSRRFGRSQAMESGEPLQQALDARHPRIERRAVRGAHAVEAVGVGAPPAALPALRRHGLPAAIDRANRGARGPLRRVHLPAPRLQAPQGPPEEHAT